MKNLILIIASFLIFAFGNAQSLQSNSNEKSMEFYEDSLSVLANYIKNETFFKDRVKANREFIPLFVQSLKNKNSFHYPFENLDFISSIYAPDSTFRLITWLVKRDDKQGNSFYGVIQKNNTARLEIYPLRDQIEPIENLERRALTEKEWYGCVYYNLLQNEIEGKNYYTIFGWDGNNAYTTKKYLDVLSFDTEGKPVFGAPIIELKREDLKRTMHRVKFEYNANATVTVNYDEDLEQIVFDHIGPEDEKSYGMYPTYIPDGTYEAMKFENGKWNYIEKVFHLTFDTPPMPAPLFKKSKTPMPFAMPKN